jgi:hypothetical protein
MFLPSRFPHFSQGSVLAKTRLLVAGYGVSFIMFLERTFERSEHFLQFFKPSQNSHLADT